MLFFENTRHGEPGAKDFILFTGVLVPRVECDWGAPF